MIKYILTSESKTSYGSKLYRIKALKDFGNVKAGDLGGWVESASNLSQEGNCWVYDNASVYDNAQIMGDAQILGDAQVSDEALIFGKAEIWGEAWVSGEALIFGNARVYDRARISGDAKIWDDARVYDRANVLDDAHIYDCAWVCGHAVIKGDAKVKSDKDYLVFKNWWRSGSYFTWTRSNDMWDVPDFFGRSFYGSARDMLWRAEREGDYDTTEFARVVDYVEGVKKDHYNPWAKL